MRELALFAGAGGGILGGALLGWRTVCAVELDPYCRRVLLARQRDGCLDRFPIWDDVGTFDGRPWRGGVDVITGGFPCQDISHAAHRNSRSGIAGSRSGIWAEMRRVVCEVVPRFVLVENSPALTFRGLGHLLKDLAALGYDARWGVLGAHLARAPHRRDRIWILASHADRKGEPVEPIHDEMARMSKLGALRRGSWWRSDPGVFVAHGLADRLDRLRAIGNGQVPAVAALAWLTLGGPL